jgi:hypothetical protein
MQLQAALCCAHSMIFITWFLKSNINYIYSQGQPPPSEKFWVRAWYVLSHTEYTYKVFVLHSIVYEAWGTGHGTPRVCGNFSVTCAVHVVELNTFRQIRPSCLNRQIWYIWQGAGSTDWYTRTVVSGRGGGGSLGNPVPCFHSCLLNDAGSVKFITSFWRNVSLYTCHP